MVMAGLAADMAVASMVSTIPVVVTGGVLMKFTEQMMPEGSRRRRPIRRTRMATRRPSRRVGRTGRTNLGIVGADFSNVGM